MLVTLRRNCQRLIFFSPETLRSPRLTTRGDNDYYILVFRDVLHLSRLFLYSAAFHPYVRVLPFGCIVFIAHYRVATDMGRRSMFLTDLTPVCMVLSRRLSIVQDFTLHAVDCMRCVIGTLYRGCLSVVPNVASESYLEGAHGTPTTCDFGSQVN